MDCPSENCKRGCHKCLGFLNTLQLQILEAAERERHAQHLRDLAAPFAPNDRVVFQVPRTSRHFPPHIVAKGSAHGRIVREHRENPGLYLVRFKWQSEGRGGETHTYDRPGVDPLDMRKLSPNIQEELERRFCHQLGLIRGGGAELEFWRTWLTRARKWHHNQQSRASGRGDDAPPPPPAPFVWTLPSGHSTGRPSKPTPQQGADDGDAGGGGEGADEGAEAQGPGT